MGFLSKFYMALSELLGAFYTNSFATPYRCLIAYEFKIFIFSQVWWCKPFITALRKQK